MSLESPVGSLEYKGGYENLAVWRKSLDYVSQIYQITEIFPKHELYGLTNQIRRAAVSVPSNIAEGCSRNSKKEFAQFLAIAVGSHAELHTQLLVAKNVGYLPDAVLQTLLSAHHEIRKMMIALKASLKTND